MKCLVSCRVARRFQSPLTTDRPSHPQSTSGENQPNPDTAEEEAPAVTEPGPGVSTTGDVPAKKKQRKRKRKLEDEEEERKGNSDQVGGSGRKLRKKIKF